jgi:hypothetical protein
VDSIVYHCTQRDSLGYCSEFFFTSDWQPPTTWTLVHDLGLGPTPHYAGVDPSLNQPPTMLGSRPNPFSVSTEILYDLGQPGRVQIRVYDVAGRLVRKVLDTAMPPGPQKTTWDGADDQGRPVPAGMYFYEVETPRGTGTRKMLLLR